MYVIILIIIIINLFLINFNVEIYNYLNLSNEIFIFY